MATQVTIKDPATAKAYFEAKMAFTTGPVELERMMKNSEVRRRLCKAGSVNIQLVQ